MKCQSGDALTENGEGLCRREAKRVVLFTLSSGGRTAQVHKNLCDPCASHWTIVNPRSCRIVGDIVMVAKEGETG